MDGLLNGCIEGWMWMMFVNKLQKSPSHLIRNDSNPTSTVDGKLPWSTGIGDGTSVLISMIVSFGDSQASSRAVSEQWDASLLRERFKASLSDTFIERSNGSS